MSVRSAVVGLLVVAGLASARLAPADVSRLLGSKDVEFFSAGGRADHRASYVSATVQVKPWFDGFVSATAR